MLSILGRTKSKRNFNRCGKFLFVSVALKAYGKLSIGIYISRAISIAYYIKGLVFMHDYWRGPKGIRTPDRPVMSRSL